MAGISVSCSWPFGTEPIPGCWKHRALSALLPVRISAAHASDSEGMNLERWRMFNRRFPRGWHMTWAILTGQGGRSGEPRKRPHADHPSARPRARMAPAGSRGVTGRAGRLTQPHHLRFARMGFVAISECSGDPASEPSERPMRIDLTCTGPRRLAGQTFHVRQIPLGAPQMPSTLVPPGILLLSAS